MTIEPNQHDADGAISEPLNAVVDIVRTFFSGPLGAGDGPAKLSFPLAAVSTEMGPSLARGADSLPAFQVVLPAVSSAVLCGAPTGEQPEVNSRLKPAPNGATVH